ncbi:imidazolonepropionase [Robiginitalea sp. SC105]|uniref:imidazolonepropionase n=1 Tax=Robiginitalea sp. SC105 TaxID=2762332 RepID=UPI00163A99D7|nr:imidazolonepropionase [Robiginitalea sp. SC105]MBC2838666.1 imidazolonepropionase [Robiginitalea sp. SC105]
MKSSPTEATLPHLIGPITQLLPMSGLPAKGALPDSALPVLENTGILMEGERIREIGPFDKLERDARRSGTAVTHLSGEHVGLPGFIDAHTHSCFAGSRARDYALRNSGRTYLEIAESGGGIWDSVTQTRKASREELGSLLEMRCRQFAADGITTLEVKSGYGLSIAEELKMLRAIADAAPRVAQDLVPTCLAAHSMPRDMEGSPEAYLEELQAGLLPVVLKEGLARRVDAFVEKGAFSPSQILPYLEFAQKLGFEITLHADQFTTGGSELAIRVGARSADHLEASGPAEIAALAKSRVVATALPGATLGLGCGYTPARALLDAGACLAIASDYNPGSAPMGDLLTQAAILGAAEKVTHAEVFAGITFRAAIALGLDDRGILAPGMLADFVLFDTDHYNEILYHQGRLRPSSVWKKGRRLPDNTATQ